MTQISMTDVALVDLLESCTFSRALPSSPRRTNGIAGYIQKLLTATTPTILIAFLGADDPDSKLTELNLNGRWAAYTLAVGWNGRADQRGAAAWARARDST